MNGRHLSLAVIALTLGMLTAPASAAPAVGAIGSEAKAAGTALVEKAARRCWWHRGHRHCRYYRGYGGYGGYYGYRPGFNFYVGPGYRHRHWGYRHRHW